MMPPHQPVGGRGGVTSSLRCWRSWAKVDYQGALGPRWSIRLALRTPGSLRSHRESVGTSFWIGETQPYNWSAVSPKAAILFALQFSDCCSGTCRSNLPPPTAAKWRHWAIRQKRSYDARAARSPVYVEKRSCHKLGCVHAITPRWWISLIAPLRQPRSLGPYVGT